MNVVFDIVHPADVHFFARCIHALKQRGDHVLVTSRQKDITLELLNGLGIAHHKISRKGSGWAGLLLEFIVRTVRLWRVARNFQPDIIVSNNSPCGPQVAAMLRCPSLVFDDTETHHNSHRLATPVVTEIHSPDCYRLPRNRNSVFRRKQRLYPGYLPLAYLHPNHFRPDTQVLKSANIPRDRPIVLLRFVGWGAAHDLGRRHLGDTEKCRLVRSVARHGTVLISAEGDLPQELESYRIRIPVEQIHHVLAYARLLISDSGTMTSEAAVVGTPTIYCDDVGLGYTDEQEIRYGLCRRIPPSQFQTLLETCELWLTSDRIRQTASTGHARLLREKIDVVPYQLTCIDALVYGKTAFL